MKIKKMILDFLLRLLTVLLPFIKIKENRVLFVSLESDVLENDFLILYNELKKNQNLEIICMLTKFKKNFIGYISYFIVCIKQFFYINSSKLVILDYNNYIVSQYKKKGVSVLQLWHASGAIKKFGNETSRDYRISDYDYVICNSESFIPSYAKAFNVKPSSIIMTGIPKQDILYDNNYREWKKIELEERYNLVDKQVILYAPTFRGRLMDDFKYDYFLNLNYVVDSLPEDYVILFRPHPLLSDEKYTYNDRIIKCTDIELFDLFCVTDVLISDYSALIFDFSILHKPIISYVPDIDEYKRDTGLFIDYEKEMPGPICYDERELINTIIRNKFNLDKVKQFQRKYVHYNDGKSSQRVINLIYSILYSQEK